MIPETLTHYRILRKVGRGGMGEVYLAEDIVLGRQVAIKVLPFDLLKPETIARFKREARTVSILNHPNIVTIHEYGEVGGIHFFVTEYCPGRTWRDLMLAPRTSDDPMRIALGVASGLAAAHAAGIVHRDIKPENVMINDAGLVKVLDFGLAKLSDSAPVASSDSAPGSIMGTIPYMAPEQIGASDVDCRADIFSLGVTMFEAVCGERPFTGNAAHEIIAAILSREPLWAALQPHARPDLDALIRSMLSKDPSLRPSAGSVAAQLETFLGASEKTLSAANLPTQRVAASVPAPNNLPAEVTSLIGREREVEVVSALLNRPDTRLITLTGPGGTGKTRLGCKVAERALTSFADGVYLVALDSIDDAGLVLSAMAHAIGVKDTGSGIEQALRESLRERSMLLVLDNFEHVMDAAGNVASLMAGATRVKFLVTSQSPLHIRGEHEIALEPLPIEPAVRLFVDRARQVRQDFELNEDNTAAVREVCMITEGMPLAIELAAVRIKLLPLQRIVERLRDPLTFLAGGPRDLPPRQRALRHTIAWSVGLLNAEERDLFARLSAFQSGWTMDGAIAVCAVDASEGEGIEERLFSLVEKSLVRRTVTGVEERFSMLAAMHRYAIELMDDATRDELRDRHLDFFVSFCTRGDEEITGLAQAIWFSRFAAEQPNIRAAIQHAIASGDVERGLRVACGTLRFWHTQGFYKEGRETLAALLAKKATVDPRLTSRAFFGLGVLADAQGDYENARVHFERNLELNRAAGDSWGVANSLNNLASVAFHRQDHENAHAIHEESLRLWRELGNEPAIALCLHNLGHIDRAQGRRDEARRRYSESVEVFQRAIDPRGIALSLMHLAALAADESDFEGARSFFERSLETLMHLGDHWHVAECMARYGDVERNASRHESAYELLEESLLIFHELGDRRSAARVLSSLARLAAESANPARALKLAAAASAIRHGIGADSGMDMEDLPRELVQSLRVQLGVEKGDSVWNEGTKMTFAEAVAFATSGSA